MRLPDRVDSLKIPDILQENRLFLDLVLGSTPVMFYGDWETTRPTAEEMGLKIDLFIQGRYGTAVAKTSRTKAPVRRRTAHVADPVD